MKILAALLVATAIVGAQEGASIRSGTQFGLSKDHLRAIDDVVAAAIKDQKLPGAVVLAGTSGQIGWREAYGSRALLPVREPMTVDTIFDVASLTKVVATLPSVMILVEQGKIRLSDPLVSFIPEMKGEGRDAITIEHLLTHTAGLAPDFDLRERWTGYDEGIAHLAKETLRSVPGTRFVYSDLSFIALGEVVHRVSGMPLDEFARRNVFVPLGMKETGFKPAASLLPRIAPTEKVSGQMNYLGDTGADAGAAGDVILRGKVHDPTAARMGGVAGHAGLFSTADDLSLYCQMLLGGGQVNGKRVLGALTVAAMTRPRAVADDGSARGLGWDIATAYSANRGDLFPLGSYGHTGFTGTSIWIDPESNTYVVFLSNRVHPDGKGDVTPLRSRIASIVAGAVMNASPSIVRSQSAQAAADILASLAKLNARTAAAAVAAPATVADAQVLTGIDVLEREKFAALAGMRVGLVTNHTGRDRAGRQTIDVLHDAPNVKLVALFAPEHGIRGVADANVPDSRDDKTGLPIYSLYGDNRGPKPEQLKELDAIVFDIQDVGARFYTYISTLGYVLESAAAAKIPVVVLDRPNPINGIDVEGPVADADKLSFTAYHRIPIRHGMTVGEIARLYNDERKFGADLRVVKMENWRRAMWLDATNLAWVNPSPNMRSLTEATLYPGIGMLETTNISVGRGTDTPFEVIGAPWLDGQALAAALNGRNIPGIRFVPTRFTPTASVFAKEDCGGVNLIVTDRTRFRPVYAGVAIAVELHRLFPAVWKADAALRLIANADTVERLTRGQSADEIARAWTAALDIFRRARAKALIYE